MVIASFANERFCGTLDFQMVGKTRILKTFSDVSHLINMLCRLHASFQPLSISPLTSRLHDSGPLRFSSSAPPVGASHITTPSSKSEEGHLPALAASQFLGLSAWLTHPCGHCFPLGFCDMPPRAFPPPSQGVS